MIKIDRESPGDSRAGAPEAAPTVNTIIIIIVIIFIIILLLLLVVVVVGDSRETPGRLPGDSRTPRTERSIAPRKERSIAPRTERSISIIESHTATFYDSSRTSSRVKHRPAQYETKVGTPISSRFRGKQRAQRRLQLFFGKRKRAERNRGSQTTKKRQCKVTQSSDSRRREHALFRMIK